MSIKTIEVPLVPMTAASFAPCGEVFGHKDGGDSRIETPTGFEHEGKVTLGTIWNAPGGLEFSQLERHYNITQSFVQLSGAPSVVCAAPATDIRDPGAFPRAEDVVGYLIAPGQGWMFSPGTWHALNRCVLEPPGASFLIVNALPNPTHVIDFATGQSEEHADLGGAAATRSLPWPHTERCQFRLRV
jgi:ureidoglycolate hydrolase